MVCWWLFVSWVLEWADILWLVAYRVSWWLFVSWCLEWVGGMWAVFLVCGGVWL